jgi:streptogramin lyase
MLSVFAVSLLFLPVSASSGETYVFERMWPSLQQPWYFHEPHGAEIDANGNLYVADRWNHRIKKFTSDGQFITKWGSYGSGDGEFDEPIGIAANDTGNVYVVDAGNNRIQKFTMDGLFVAQWGSYGSGDVEFNEPNSIAIDSTGNVYVVDAGNNRIQKFTSEGQFVSTWGSEGSGDGEFRYPTGIAIDSSGNVYVADTDNNRIEKFTSEGTFITMWGSEGSGDGEFRYPTGIAIDSSGNVYVADTDNNRIEKFTLDGQFIGKWTKYGLEEGDLWGPVDVATDNNGNVYVSELHNNRVQKFTSEGTFITAWQSHGSGDGEFAEPSGITTDNNGSIYVSDRWNYRIKKFTSDGQFITDWGSYGSGDGEFNEPNGTASDGSGNVYVVDTGNNRIQKFTLDGLFVAQWGSYGSGDGEFNEPIGIAANGIGDVLVVDTGNNRIQKFTSEGQFITTWGILGSGDGEFRYPTGIFIDNSGDVYVADSYNYRIQKFTSEGQFITTWGSHGSGDGEFNEPNGIAIDSSGDVYVADSYNYRIQKFTSEGQFITTWGSHGSSPGQMDLPFDLTVSADGHIYVADTYNHRIQVFKPVAAPPNNKALIIAGGGPYPGNHLWDATQMCANFAYRTLTYQGFTKETISYLTSDTDLDLDNNGIADDVDGDATGSNLHHALTEWASDAQDLFVYLVDHGGNGTFRMSETETLSAQDLDSWLDQLQGSLSGTVTVIYDACESGSFLSSLTPPSGKERIVIGSTSPGESAYFVTQGSVSFSTYFWTQVFHGINVGDAFDVAGEAIGYTTEFQHPLLDDTGNGIGNEPEDGTLAQHTSLGSGTVIHGEAPVIARVSPDQTITGVSAALLWAEGVTDSDGIARVWAVIRPPHYHQGSSDNPIQELPSLDLMPVGGDRYEAIYEGFNSVGTYQIALYARDRIGNTSIPELTTLSVDNPLHRRALIVVGGGHSDPLWPGLERVAALAYETLTFQGYADEDLYVLSQAEISGVQVDASPSLAGLQDALTTWASTSTQDLLVYLVGRGDQGGFQLNDTETLTPSQLGTWLDTLQDSIPGKVVVLSDASCAGSFLSPLAPPAGKERIVIASTGPEGPAYFLIEGHISFSAFFWRSVLNGALIRDAFVHALNAIGYACPGQGPQLDDSGNGIGNESGIDGQLARTYTIGTGIMLAGDEPLIGSVSPPQTLSGTPSATIWAEEVTTTGTIDTVWAVITPPDSPTDQPGEPVTDPPTLELAPVGGGRYEGTYGGFRSQGSYGVTLYAMDTNGAISLPKPTSVTQTDTITTIPLYFPHIDTTSPWETEIALINTSPTQSLTGTLKGFSNTGQLIDTMGITLGPHGRRQITIADEFANHTNIGYLIFEGDADTLCGYTKFSTQGTYRVAIPAVKEIHTSDIYLSHIASNAEWWTGVSLLNTTSTEKTLTLDFDTGQTKTLTLAAHEHQAFTIAGLFEGQSQPDINSGVITNAGGVVGLELFGSGNQLSGILLKDDTSSTLYYPHVEGGEWWTGIVAYNPSSSSATLTITPYNTGGTILSSQSLSIPGKGKYIGTVASLSLPSNTAWFTIESSTLITGFELFGTTNGNQLAGYTGVGISGREGVFAKIEKDGWTGIAFVNIEDTASSVMLTAYDNYGDTVATQTVSLGAYAKEVRLAQDFFTQDIGAATYIGYASDREIVGFQLNGSSDGMMLDGLPGM